MRQVQVIPKHDGILYQYFTGRCNLLFFFGTHLEFLAVRKENGFGELIGQFHFIQLLFDPLA